MSNTKKRVMFKKQIDGLDFKACKHIAEKYFNMLVGFEDCESKEERDEEKAEFVRQMKMCLIGEQTIQDFIEGVYFEDSDLGDNIQNMFKVYKYLEKRR